MAEMAIFARLAANGAVNGANGGDHGADAADHGSAGGDTVAAAPFAAGFHRAFDVATVITVALWHLGAAGAALLVYLGEYRSPAVGVAVWGLQLLVIVVGAVALLRGKDGPAVIGPMVAVALASGLAMAVNCPGGQLLKVNWGWATTGLIGVLLLLHRPVSRIVAFQAANGGTVLAVLLATGTCDRHSVAGFVTLLYASGSIQLAMIAGARVFRYSGGMAATAAAARWRMASREAVINEVARARQDRYQEVRRLIAPILRDLAAGVVDPAEPAVRGRCATAEAMLRQLLAEHEDIPDPLLQALRPGIDEVMRRGVVVDVVRVGELTGMGIDERTASAIAEVPLAVLAKARGHARVTIVPEGADRVSVSVLAGTDAAVPRFEVRGDVTVTSDHDGELLWVEVSWHRT
ncbi:hypothetical protein [Actinomadura sp. NEAU-AAG7]|uniref:hypothetical protein n=1 Tax=Actinomadura sp. NEAU-AAG7 TaxID=2839640 RepID=UPI001BE4131F|nr:hypothetical protein [Actinomadura sp. NEAU-AAG7]MBT2207831.1 hypothetical protein [Actinomadura sp. NEAU-AAG7]